jgi:hypothetical protein
MLPRSLFAGLCAGVLLLHASGVPAAAPPCTAPPNESRYLQHPPLYYPSANEAAAPDKMVRKVYAVADLVIPVAGTAAAEDGSGKPGQPLRTHEARLIDLICATISPETWSVRGGAGSIDYFPIGMALVVSHHPNVHEEIADLLAALRRLQDVEVSVELRLLTVSDECLAKLGVEEGSSGTKPSVARLDEAQLRLLLETVQADARSVVLQAPKLTVFNGQRATLDLSEKQCFVTGVEMVGAGDRKTPQPRAKDVNTGLRASVLPVVSADNRTVTMRLSLALARMDAPKPQAAPLLWNGRPVLLTQPAQPPRYSVRSFETTLKLADGATALLTGWTQHREARSQVCPPVLSGVPYVGQLFRTVSYGKEREHLLVLVTPRVIVRSEEEERPPPAPREDSAASEQPAPSRPVPTGQQAPREPEKDSAIHVNRRSFRLEYALDDIGPTGVGKLEVWVTRDGRDWARHPEAVPAKGHATVTVPHDGRWGFTLIPRSGAGRTRPAPRAMEAPQVWVEVDTRPPGVAILDAAVRVVDGEGVLRVGFQVEDSHLRGGPVAVSCAPTPEGPWSPLARGLPEVGEFTCPLRSLPHEFYVRVQAEDRAGNVGQAVSERIQADLKTPRVREVKVKVEE